MILDEYEDPTRRSPPPEYTCTDRSEYDGDTFDDEPTEQEPTTDTP
jgi:hypothetical protein